MPSQPPIRIAISSDQPIFRRGLTSLIIDHPEFQLVGEARDVHEAVQLSELIKPDLLLLDLKALPDQSKEILSAVRQRSPQTRVVFLYSANLESIDYLDVEDERLYYFCKDLSEDEFASAVKDIYHSKQADQEKDKAPSVDDDLKPLAISFSASSPAGDVRDREMKMAGRIQADILPEKPPEIPGWDISVYLSSARETSGDFYDFIHFGGNRLGIVVADVTDKGIGAALFMALSSTLIRTYAARYPTLPALTMDIVNDRILTDTRGGMFVSAFYGVLETQLGRLRYVNSGHPPGLHISPQRGRRIDRLLPTGMALGLVENTHWKQKVVRMSPGDALVLYTDGVTEAEDSHERLFGEQRLIEVVRTNCRGTAKEIQGAILEAVHQFTGDSGRRDDIAMLVIRREP
jgi:DNA-binding NarL/FixJ family response regulator